ncbi:hypothetical protein L7F22_063926 [Adiantum nelumboides]|nr:hypothetical protein [Adiantum nelumboides]
MATHQGMLACDKCGPLIVEEPSKQRGAPKPKETEASFVDDDVNTTDSKAQEGMEVVQRMVQGNIDLDLGDMVKKSKNRKSKTMGTVALELLEQIPELDVIVVPISGGGLIAKAINPKIKIFAAEPKGADDAAQSKAAGKLILPTDTHTVADGLRACLGSITWPVVRDKVDEVVTVTEEEIVNAMQMCYEILKVVVEPSGAVGLAAVLSSQFQSRVCKQTFQHVGIVLSGGNVDLGDLGTGPASAAGAKPEKPGDNPPKDQSKGPRKKERARKQLRGKEQGQGKEQDKGEGQSQALEQDE